jgi:hypothetical protein
MPDSIGHPWRVFHCLTPTHSPQPPLPPRRAEEGEPHFFVCNFQRIHRGSLPLDLVRHDVEETVVVNGVRCAAAGWMPDRVGHDRKARAVDGVDRMGSVRNSVYDRLTEIVTWHPPHPSCPTRSGIQGFQRVHRGRLPPDWVRHDVEETVVVNGVRCAAAGWMPDRVGHDRQERAVDGVDGIGTVGTRDYDSLSEILPQNKQWRPIPVMPVPERQDQMRLPLFRPAGRERGLGGVSGGKSKGEWG